MAAATNGDGRRGGRTDNDSNNNGTTVLSRLLLMTKGRERFILAGCAIALAIFCAAPMKFIGSVWHVITTSIGMAVGVGVGLGLAMHVYERLQTMQKAHDEERQQQRHNKNNKKSSQTKNKLQRIDSKIKQPKSASKQQHNRLEDGTSYASLMSSAGYYIGDKVLRGQVLKSDDRFWDVQYKFTSVAVDKQHGPRLLHEDWPSLPEPVTRELGRFVEHIMRDYISTWYSRLDAGCIHFDERQRRKDGIPRDGGGGGEGHPSPPNTTTTMSSPESTNEKSGRTEDEDTKARHNHRSNRKMVFSTKTYRYIPMIDQTYKTLSAAFGNLAIRAEHVNIFSLALLKWTQILAHTFKVYRMLRGIAQTKNNTENPTEIQITREFLLAGKLHRAVTFGLDVPSLLFADKNAKDCGTGTDKPPTTDPDQVLEQRLFGTRILAECELDYNRVVAHRLIRALIPKSDSASHVTLALLVEIFSFAVLQPIMNLWIPSFLNNAIKRATQNKKSTTSNNVDTTTRDSSMESSVNESKAKSSGGTVACDSKKDIDTANSDIPVNAGATNLPGQKIKSKSNADHVADLGDVQSSALTKEISATSTDTSSDFPSELDLGSMNTFPDDTSLSAGEIILRLTSLALEDLQKFMDFEQCRLARANNLETEVDWDDPLCQEAVLKLVMVIEAAILHGQVKPPAPKRSNDDTEGEGEIGWSSPESTSMSQVLMQMTSNMDAFEETIERSESQPISNRVPDDRQEEDYEPDAGEISTLRTLISTWLHTGQGYLAISLLVKGNQTLLRPFYSRQAFLQDRSHADEFLAKLEVLDSLDVMVETMATLAMPKMDLEAEASLILSAATEELATDSGHATNVQKEYRRVSATSLLRSGIDEQASGSSHDSLALFPGISNARYLDFHRNAAFASSLRSERERRIRSWASLRADESLHSIWRKSAPPDDIELHRELHNLSRMFYNGTNVMTIRDAARKSETAEQPQTKTSGEQEKVSLITVEMVSNRRRIEVPDDDSSFLLRAQPRPLNPVSVHRDDRNHDQSYKCFLATYEEPAIQLGSNRFSSGRYIRRCLIQYYPGDRTALIVPHNDARKLDRRKGLPRTQNASTPKSQTSASYLTGSFLKNRHLCQKWVAKGTGTQNFLSSSVMEASDFNAIPRSGRALDFVYRMSLFEKPVADLAGKRFIVQDSAGRGAHRADASSLEVSDASLSALLMTIGRDLEAGERKVDGAESAGAVGGQAYRHRVEMGPDGYPMIFMKFSTKHGDQVSTEIKPYRVSFVRAALMVTSARQEAQLQCLVECVKAGSAKSATKSRTEAQLRPTLKILEYANDRSPDKSKSSSLLRDLKLGVYHIDREQLRRNGLLNPRSPTVLVALNAKVEGAVQAKDIPETIGGKLPPSFFLYKIRCVALVELLGVDEEADDMEPYYLDDGSLARQYREEWVIYRSMKDFQALHRHLKSEVAAGEYSASTGSRLVGAATAAFVNNTPDRKHREALIPSLAQASKTGAIAVTKKAVARRGELLDKYLEYLLAPNHLLNRCTGLLLFLGASFPFPPEVRVMKTPPNLIDPLGRLDFIRSVTQQAPKNPNRNVQQANDGKASLIGEKLTDPSTADGKNDPGESEDAADIIENLSLSVLNKVDQVPLAEVRNRIVELIRYQFGFENASFFRSRMLSALETASFVAITKASTFRKLLHDLHIKHLNPEALAGWIRKILDILWPDGVWMTPPPPFTEQEEAELRKASREGLHRVFPDQISIVLGEELTRDGLDLVHEMLQNRMVVKSLFYMLFDTLWIEVFPEFRDVCTGADALDIE